jgi:hypothetical protein
VTFLGDLVNKLLVSVFFENGMIFLGRLEKGIVRNKNMTCCNKKITSF